MPSASSSPHTARSRKAGFQLAVPFRIRPFRWMNSSVQEKVPLVIGILERRLIIKGPSALGGRTQLIRGGTVDFDRICRVVGERLPPERAGPSDRSQKVGVTCATARW